MSNMTSSTNKLTDFSIDSIINSVEVEAEVEAAASSHQQQELNSPLTSNYKPISGQHAINNTTVQSSQHISRKYRPKNFQCLACKMAFSNNGQLKNHVRIHTGERPFRCNHQGCNKTFTRNEELTRHKLIHTGLRPHSCNVCGKRFGRKDHLKKHVKTHERKKLRKKVSNSQSNSFLPHDAFVPKPKSTYNQHSIAINPIISPPSKSTLQLCTQQKDLKLTSPINNPTTRQNNFFMTPNSLPMASTEIFSTSFPISQPTSITTPSQFTSTNATETIQRLASDYWNKWYNLLGFYQQQQQHYPTSLNSLFRRLS